MDVHVDATGEEQLARGVDLTVGCHLATDLHDPITPDTDVRSVVARGGDDRAAADDEVERLGLIHACAPFTGPRGR